MTESQRANTYVKHFDSQTTTTDFFFLFFFFHLCAGVKQPFEVQVYDDFAIKGNTGVSVMFTDFAVSAMSQLTN